MTLAERERAARTRLNYPPGTRIELKSMAHDPDPVPPGTRGTVYNVNGYGDIEMNWDNGRSLSIIPGEDSFRKLTPEEIAQEQATQEQQMEGMECQTL